MKDISFKAALLISATGSLYGTAQAQTPSPAATEQSADAEATSAEIGSFVKRP